MNEQKNDVVTMEKVVSLCKRRGFIFPGSEIYGGLAGTFDYGPFGITLKKNIENLWWKMFINDRDDMYGVDAAILMNPKAWVASGHVGGFSDPMIDCLDCKARFRTDSLVNKDNKLHLDYIEYLKTYTNKTSALVDESKQKLEEAKSIVEYSKSTDNFSESLKKEFNKNIRSIDLNNDIFDDLAIEVNRGVKFLGKLPAKFLTLKEIHCEVCKKLNWSESRQFNMMFSTNVGPVQNDESITYLRPETAGGMFVNFKNVVDTMHPKLPFGMGQIGKAFRNEIAPRDFIFRVRELEQMEIEYFVRPETWEVNFEHWRNQMHEFIKRVGLDTEKVHELEVEGDDLAHYSKRTIDFEFDYPFGRKELYGLAYRTDFDLSAHQEGSKQKLEYFDEEKGEKLLPHVIEPSFGVGRTILAVLCSAYKEDTSNQEDVRPYLALTPRIAPIKVAVFPLLKNKEVLTEKAKELHKALKHEFGAVVYDETGSIGKRYRKQDEIGTPFCVTVDFESVEGDTAGTYTIRDRDTGEQSRVSEEELFYKIKNSLI